MSSNVKQTNKPDTQDEVSKQAWQQASIVTANSLNKVAQDAHEAGMTQLSLPQMTEMVESVSKAVPAGNIPSLILERLTQMRTETPPQETMDKDIYLLFDTSKRFMSQAMYMTFAVTPAKVIGSYQKLLQLAGMDPLASFPEGVWQFYVNYALREDTARHTNETHGFDTILKRYGISLSLVDRVTAWVMGVIHTLHEYDSLLENEWRERTYTYILQTVMADSDEAEWYERIYRRWEVQRPFRRSHDAKSQETYARYRRRLFDEFLREAIDKLTPEQQMAWGQAVKEAKKSLPAYQKQMTIASFLEPHAYGETRHRIPIDELQVGIIHDGHYYLIPACKPDTSEPASVMEVRAHVAAIVADEVRPTPTSLIPLATMKRAALAGYLPSMSKLFRQNLDLLCKAPILINTEPRPRGLPLSDLRQAERGIGSHPLTIFDTHETFVFDQSHIFFDGAWGAGLAEIITGQALAWGHYLNNLKVPAGRKEGVEPLLFVWEKRDRKNLVQVTEQVMLEVSAETDAVALHAILALRKLCKQRNDLITVTVNDLLILYRAIHAITYQPQAQLVMELEQLATEPESTEAAMMALNEIQNHHNPALLIPIDATHRIPGDRVYPMVFEVPLEELNFLNLHRSTVRALDAYETGTGDRTPLYAEFDRLQRTYLANLAGFGMVLTRAKLAATAGESVSTQAIRMLANLPTAVQRMLDDIPSRFEVLNDMIKGREVFSNCGAVVSTSSLTRFNTAKDDNQHKVLAWGVLTDAKGIMHITLRDFRPHVWALIETGRRDLAQRITADYLQSYAIGLNVFVQEVRRITAVSRETQLVMDM
ncbi:MAG TPA: hypothetical protein VLL52_09855 [Anaerolineae bacterium]|nr:hypothetical protein [Anaerolineae bacterium]